MWRKRKKFGRLIHNSQFTLNIKDVEKEKQVWKVNSQLTICTEHKRCGEREKKLEGNSQLTINTKHKRHGEREKRLEG